MLEATPQNGTIPVDFLLLEDEPLTVFDEREKATAEVAGAEGGPTLRIAPRFFEADNLADANAALEAGRCDVLIADFNVKTGPHSEQGTSDCLDLLRSVKEEKAFILVVGHTAYDHLLRIANREGLTIETISKDRSDSIRRVVEGGTYAGLLIANFRKQLEDALLALKQASEEERDLKRQQGLAHAREMFRNIEIPDCLADDSDYRKTLRKLVPILYRVSTVGSETFDLRTFSTDFVDLVEPLVRDLMKPRFSYQTSGLPRFQMMEAKGYNVWMRITCDGH
jgi:hypothetical protein